MKKTIKTVSPMAHGHVMLEFEDGTKQVVHRGDHEVHDPQPGQAWPPDGHEHSSEGINQNVLKRVELT